MNGDFYLIAEVKKDDGEWELIPYMKDKTLMQHFQTIKGARVAAASLQRLLGEKNPCIVRIMKQTSYIDGAGVVHLD